MAHAIARLPTTVPASSILAEVGCITYQSLTLKLDRALVVVTPDEHVRRTSTKHGVKSMCTEERSMTVECDGGLIIAILSSAGNYPESDDRK